MSSIIWLEQWTLLVASVIVKCKKMLLILIHSTNVYFACLVQVSVGTLLAFTIAAISVLILRYIPPNMVPLPPSLQEPIDSTSVKYDWSHLETNEKDAKANVGTYGKKKPLLVKEDASIEYPLIPKHLAIGNCEL